MNLTNKQWAILGVLAFGLVCVVVLGGALMWNTSQELAVALPPTITMLPTSTVVPTSDFTSTPNPPRTPKPTGTFVPTKESVRISDTSKGLGLSRQNWEKLHGRGKEEYGFTHYDNSDYAILYMDNRIFHLEHRYNIEPKLHDARLAAEALIPNDSIKIETYSPGLAPYLVVDLFSSEWLKAQFESDVWFYGEPGQFIILYDVYEGRITHYIIATGNNP